jgi:predicted DNA-binding antitoxin AbrB/MazE fold protein
MNGIFKPIKDVPLYKTSIERIDLKNLTRLTDTDKLRLTQEHLKRQENQKLEFLNSDD